MSLIFNFHVFVNILLLHISGFILLYWKKTYGLISFLVFVCFRTYWPLICGLTHDLVQKKKKTFHVKMRNMYIPYPLDESFCKCLLRPFALQCGAFCFTPAENRSIICALLIVGCWSPILSLYCSLPLPLTLTRVDLYILTVLVLCAYLFMIVTTSC